MKNLVAGLSLVALLSVGMVSIAAESSFEDRLWDVKLDGGHVIGESLSPKQMFTSQKQAPFQAPFQAPNKMELQAPSKLSAPVRATKVCTLIPGRAARVARRADRAARAELRLEGRTLLEVSQGLTVMENGACTTCNSGRTMLENPQGTLTSLTTRELLEGGQITRQVRTINEPGVCGGNGNGGGRRGLFGRR